MVHGKPVIVHGDGQSLWVLTHADDFAAAFVRLLGRDETLGEAYHLTSDEANTWDRIFAAIADALGVEAKIIHVPSDTLARYDPDARGKLLGDKACSVIFDNTKVRQAVGDWRAEVEMRDGMKRVAPYVRERMAVRMPDPRVDALVDRIIAEQEALGSKVCAEIELLRVELPWGTAAIVGQERPNSHSAGLPHDRSIPTPRRAR